MNTDRALGAGLGAIGVSLAFGLPSPLGIGALIGTGYVAHKYDAMHEGTFGRGVFWGALITGVLSVPLFVAGAAVGAFNGPPLASKRKSAMQLLVTAAKGL